MMTVVEPKVLVEERSNARKGFRVSHFGILELARGNSENQRIVEWKDSFAGKLFRNRAFL